MARFVYYLGITMLVASIFATRPAKGAEPLSEADFSAVNRRLTDLEKRVADLEAKDKPAAFKVAPVKVAPATVMRQASGHTHTCAAGHTWDHTMDGGTHKCPFPGCGLEQWTQDSFPRAITGSYGMPSFSSGSSGCANGRCETPMRTKNNDGRWYLGKNIGR